MPIECPACGTPSPEGSRFCAHCGSPLGDEHAPVREERRVVSILFADLAGFTERSDRADPEDVRRILRPFHTAAKETIDLFGGTLDKFIGDAVLGVFGAPVAHEDDAERAVRAAVRLQDRVAELNRADQAAGMRVRAAVNTGEAMVSFGAGPQVGESVAGDVVNTASRLQSVAPEGGVLVGEATYRATGRAIRYRALPPVRVKGKSEPLRVWLVEELHAPAGRLLDEEMLPFVGRTHERILLRELFDRTIRERSAQLLTIVGDPGIGKSRLAADLRAHIEGLASPVAWRQGRALPYGEGVAFWPLGEVVKSTAGILESDDREQAAAKLGAAIAAIEPRPTEREWMLARLGPLVGLAEDDAERIDREEYFAAWLAFLEAEAATLPLVVVFEDLHWADPAMLDFLDMAVDALAGAPVLIVATARPELFDIRPTWGGGRPNAGTIALSPLTDREIGELLESISAGDALGPEARATLSRNAGGNPLYAREFVRMIADRTDPSGEGGDAGPGEVAVPESVQAIIAARLDALPSGHRSLLQDAAVMGEVFWSGGLEALAGRAADGVEQRMRELLRRGLLQRSSASSMRGQSEYRFSHGLIRDVTYRQIPRAGRARRHLAAADWIEQVAGDRVADRAELVAHHYLQALELARALGPEEAPEDPGAIQERARRSLVLAAEQAAVLDAGRSATFYEQALALAPPGHPARPDLLTSWASMAWRAGRLDHAATQRALDEAASEALAAGDLVAAGTAKVRLTFHYGFQGQTQRSREALAEAIRLLEQEPPGPELARAYISRADEAVFAGRSEESLEWAQRAIDLARRTGADLVEVMGLHIRGNAKLELGDEQGIEDLHEALRRSLELGSAVQAVTSYDFLGEWLWVTQNPRAGLEMAEIGIELAERRGLVGYANWTRAGSLWMLFDLGWWDRLLEETEHLMAWEELHGASQVGSLAMPYRARVLVHRGRVEEAARLQSAFIPRAREIEDLQILAPALATAAMIERARADAGAALRFVDEFDAATANGPEEYREAHFPDVVRVCAEAGSVDRAERLLAGARGRTVRQRNCVRAASAALAAARGEHDRASRLYADAVMAWADFGHLPEQAFGLVGWARSLRALGRDAEAEARSTEAHRLLASLGIPAPD